MSGEGEVRVVTARPDKERVGAGTEFGHGAVAQQRRIAGRVVCSLLEAEQVDLKICGQIRDEIVVTDGRPLMRGIGNLRC